MDAKSAPSEPLKYQTWFLKVSIHCEGCRRKVKKVLQNIDGVFTTTVDPQQQKVTVTGSVGVETLIKKLIKAGKHAEVWPENVAAGKGKNSSGKDKKQKKEEPQSVENSNAESKGKEKSAEKRNGESKSAGAGESEAADEKGGQSEGGCGGKKKKKKGQNNNGGGAACGDAGAHSGSQPECSSGQMNLSPTRQQTYCYPQVPVMYLPIYNRLSPMEKVGGSSYYVSPFPCIMDHDCYHHRLQSAPLVPFEIFSDENANGCSIM